MLLLAAGFCLAACHKRAHPCQGDADCGEGEVCFADGCGDPARGIRVEASPSTAGRVSRDIVLEEVHARQDLQLDYPPTLQGSVSVLVPDPPHVLRYSENAVVIRGKGASEIIPGLTRTFEITLPPPNRDSLPDASPERLLNPDGSFSFALSAGIYSITLSTLDPTVPPGTAQTTAALRAGTISTVDLSLGALRPPLALYFDVTDAQAGDLEVQAFSDPVNLQPLSQRTSVSVARDPGHGLQLSPSVRLNPTFVVQLSPRDPGALIPQKTFGPIPSNPLPSQVQVTMGDYGNRVLVSGTIVDALGTGIAAVTVYVVGLVGGGGTFRSQSVQTDALGNFTLPTLRSASGSTSILWAIPPAQSGSGIVRRAVALRADTALGVIPCPDKVTAQGNVYTSDESNAPGVRVIAAPLQPLPGRPLPGSGDQSSTDDAGVFSLKLDPAIYRLDFIPAGQLPRTSRFAVVSAEPLPSGGFRPVQLPDVFLSKARKISGTVRALASPDAEAPSFAPFTSLRFFRVIMDVSGQPSSVLLAETVSDGTGSYSVSLPTR